MSEFDPNSSNAMFATILTELQNQNGVLSEIKDQTTRTNGRVTALEKWRAEVIAIEAAEERAEEKATKFWERIEVKVGLACTACAAIGGAVSYLSVH